MTARNRHLQSTFDEVFSLLFWLSVLGNYTLAANFIYATENPNRLIILEDLSPLGFQMVSRQNGCDLNHCFLVLEKLASFHAASVVAKEKVTKHVNC